jgi:hypothetical protein
MYGGPAIRDDAQPSRTLGVGGALDGMDVLPGFTYPLARLFAFA